MKIVLLNSSFVMERKDQIEATEPHLKVGVASLASFLRENGFDVRILDPEVKNLDIKKTVESILSSYPDIVGFSPYTVEIIDAFNIARLIKSERKDIKTVVGGPHASALPIETLNEFSSFDISVIGEGELSFKEIAEGRKLSEIKGIAYREGDNIHLNPPRETVVSLNDLPYPAWDLYELNSYGSNVSLPVEPLRGCPYGCIFCYRTLGRKVRYKNPERIVDEIEYCVNTFGINSFRFLAGTFPLSKSHAMEVCNKILERNLNIKWSASTRVDTIDRELMKKMKESGCEGLAIGVESVDSNLLRLCGKRIEIEDIKRTFKAYSEVGIKAGANFILGLPHETRETISKTKKLALELLNIRAVLILLL